MDVWRTVALCIVIVIVTPIAVTIVCGILKGIVDSLTK